MKIVEDINLRVKFSAAETMKLPCGISAYCIQISAHFFADFCVVCVAHVSKAKFPQPILPCIRSKKLNFSLTEHTLLASQCTTTPTERKLRPFLILIC
jgi:hypothetical protein